jgi:hypothetical protein
MNKNIIFYLLSGLLFFFVTSNSFGQKPKFSVIAFYKDKTEKAHESFVHEANSWFAKTAYKYHFRYYSTNN